VVKGGIILRLYVSKTGNSLNAKPLSVETISENICLNPHYSSVLLKNKKVNIMMDSGAFQDIEKSKRVERDFALERQLKLENKVGVVSEKIVSYDFIGDYKETLAGNQFLVNLRRHLGERQLVLMVQGNTLDEYIFCLKETLSMAKPNDCIGFGGVANAGKVGDVKKKLLDAIKIGLPMVQKTGVRKLHIFGVATFDILKEIANIKNIIEKYVCDMSNFEITCDTASFEINSVMGRVIDEENEKWVKVYKKEDKLVNYHPADLTLENVQKAIRIIKKY
jgi:hypothetical protein